MASLNEDMFRKKKKKKYLSNSKSDDEKQRLELWAGTSTPW